MPTTYHLTQKSSNAKTGPIPVTTTSSDTCPDTCPHHPTNDATCYGLYGPLGLHWSAVSSVSRGITLEELCARIRAFPPGQLWRHNQAGDLPGENTSIDEDALDQLVLANAAAGNGEGARGFTYSHKHTTARTLTACVSASLRGFRVNLSADSLEQADALYTLVVSATSPSSTSPLSGPARTPLPAPIVVTLPSSYATDPTKYRTLTPAGRVVVVCPAAREQSTAVETKTKTQISCATCELCALPRTTIVGFPAHGTKRKSIDIKRAQAR